MPQEIDPTADRPLYKQLVDLIRAQIERGEFAPGQRLPAQKDYMQQYWLSRDTVDRALTTLRFEGLIVTDRRGSRVRPNHARKVVPLDRGTVRARQPTDPERKQLGIEQGEPLLLVTRDGQNEEIYPANQVEIRTCTERPPPTPRSHDQEDEGR